MKKRTFSLLLFTFIIFPLYSQLSGPSDIRMFLDYARFRYDKNETYVEIYYLLYNLKPDTLNRAKDVWLDFELSEAGKDSVLAKTNLMKFTFEGQQAASNSSSNVKGNLFKITLPIGKKYEFTMTRWNENRTVRLDSLKQVFSTPSFETEKIALSDLELCSNIVTGSTNTRGPFYKNTLEVFPNPMRMYGPETPELHYYIEVYNLKAEDSRGNVNIEVAIADKAGHILERKNYTRSRNYESLVEFDAFNVANFKSGLYTLNFAVTDSVNDYSIYTRNSFYVMNAAELSSQQETMLLAFSQSEYFSMPEADLNKAFAQVRYIATREEAAIFQSLGDVESKRMFMFKFWYEREQANPGVKDEYYTRIDYADSYYAFSNLPGWQSDRGRIYIVYGKPSVVNRYPSAAQSKPYEIWIYHELEGGVKFLFMDDSGFGDYKLKTTNKRGELHDSDYDHLLLFEQ